MRRCGQSRAQLAESAGATVPAKRPIRGRDLLTLRMGFGYIMEASSAAFCQMMRNTGRRGRILRALTR